LRGWRWLLERDEAIGCEALVSARRRPLHAGYLELAPKYWTGHAGRAYPEAFADLVRSELPASPGAAAAMSTVTSNVVLAIVFVTAAPLLVLDEHAGRVDTEVGVLEGICPK
jgi:hypothetical protein